MRSAGITASAAAMSRRRLGTRPAKRQCSARLQYPAEGPLQLRHGILVVAAAMRQHDPFRCPCDHLQWSTSNSPMMADETELHVDRRLAIGIGCSERLHDPSQEMTADARRLEVLDEVGDDERSACPVKEFDLGQECARYKTLRKAIIPRF